MYVVCAYVRVCTAYMLVSAMYVMHVHVCTHVCCLCACCARQVLGAWCIQVWMGLGKPSKFHLVELGPGRGTMMKSVLMVCHQLYIIYVHSGDMLYIIYVHSGDILVMCYVHSDSRSGAHASLLIY